MTKARYAILCDKCNKAIKDGDQYYRILRCIKGRGVSVVAGGQKDFKRYCFECVSKDEWRWKE